MTAPPPLSGFRIVPAYLDRPAQETLLAALSTVFACAPLYTAGMPKTGSPPPVPLTNSGPPGGAPVEAASGYSPLTQEPRNPGPAMPPICFHPGKPPAPFPNPPT